MVPKKAFLHFHVTVRNKQYNFFKRLYWELQRNIVSKKRLYRAHILFHKGGVKLMKILGTT